jgi:CubicO group peptidase (beta-lactamase class C family)
MRIPVAVILSASLAVGTYAQSTAQSITKSVAQRRLDEKVPIWIKAFNVTGIAIAYIENGKLAWTAFYGEQIPGGPPANEKTLYNVASLTKPISAEIILRLASDGKLSLDEPMYSYWTDSDLKDNAWAKLLTPRLCLSHQTGFANWRRETNNVLTIQWEPGTQTSYSGEGYNYVARFAEKKTGRSFEDLAQRYVFDPIGMKDTSYTPKDWWHERQAKPVESGSRTQWFAADLLRTTVGEYAKFMISVMHNQGLTKEIAAERLRITRDVLSSAGKSVICEDARDPARCEVTYGFGLGWRVVKLDGETIVDHTGSDADVKTLAFFLPQRQTGVVIFTDGPDVGHQAIDRIVRVLYPNQLYVATLWPN